MAVLLSDGGLMGVPDDADQLDPEVLQTRAIFDAARAGLLASVSGSQDAIDLAEAQRLLDALTVARILAEDAEDRVLEQRGLLTAAEAARRAVTRRSGAGRPAVHRMADSPDSPDSPYSPYSPYSVGDEAGVIRLPPGRAAAPLAPARGAASVVLRAVLPAAAALAGAALARRFRQG
jgi:hypothetical protein